MQRLEASGAVRPIYGSLGVKRLRAVLLHLFAFSPSFLVYLIFLSLTSSTYSL